MKDTLSSSVMCTSGKGIAEIAKVLQVAMTAEQQFLASLDQESIRIFLYKYDAYCRELKACESQFVQKSLKLFDSISTVGLVNYKGSEQIESAAKTDMIDGYTDAKKPNRRPTANFPSQGNQGFRMNYYQILPKLDNSKV